MNQDNNTKGKKRFSEFWHRLFGQNLSIKILSILGAVLVWLLIININDPYKTKNFLVNVTTINEEALTSVNKVYEIIEGRTATVTVRGKRSVVDNLDSSDILAQADLSELSSVNAVAVRAMLKSGRASDVEIDCTAVLKVSLEDMETKQFKITVDTKGTPAEGFSIGECVARPNVIEVTGGESVIDRISTVRVSLNVNGASENFSKRLEPVAYDKRDNKVTSSTLTFSTNKVKVRAKLLQNKTIPVKVKISGEPADGYEFVEASCLPESIEVAGSQKVLADISELEVPIDISNLTSISSDLEREISIIEYLPENTIVSEEHQMVSVKIVIEKWKSKKIQIRVDNLKLNNVADGYVAGVYNNTGIVDMTIEGRESVLDALPDTAFTGYIDCKGLKAGEYMLPVKIDLEKTCSVAKEVKVRVVISREKVDSTATPTPEATSEPQDNETEQATIKPEEE